MNLTLPDPTVTLGPTWATELNTAFGGVDAHDHSPGYGLPVPSAGININSDLEFNGFNATEFRSVRFQDLLLAPSDPADLTCLSAVGGDLYYNDGNGVQIQITAGGALNAASVGGIGGDYGSSDASVFYTLANQTYSFWQDTNTPGSIDVGNVVIREPALSANGITVQSPASLTAAYNLTLFTGLPGATSFVTLDNTGLMAASYTTDNSTIEVASNLIQVKDGGITTAKLADGAATYEKTGPANVTSYSTSSGAYSTSSTSDQDVTNCNRTITAEGGKTVIVSFVGDGSSSAAYIDTNSGTNAIFTLQRNGTTVNTVQIQTDTQIPVGALNFVDVGVTAGSRQYALKVRCTSGSGTVTVNRCRMVVYEI